MLLLGGGTTGETNVLSLCTQASPRTVAGYLSQVIAAGAGAPLPDPMNFVTQVHPNLTGNLFLLCGDGNMEPMAPAISGAAAAPARRLSQMAGGYYPVHGHDVQINSARVTDCIDAIDALLAMVN